MVSALTLLKLTPVHQWNPSLFSYTQRNHHHSTAFYCFFSKPQRKPNLVQISSQHKQLNIEAKAVDDSVFADYTLAGSGRICGTSFSSSRSFSYCSCSSCSSPSPSPSFSWWSSFSPSWLSLKFHFSSGWFFALFWALAGVVALSLVIFQLLYFVFKFLKHRYEISRSHLKTSDVKLQVGLLGSGKTIQQALHRLAENADTVSTNEEILLSILDTPKQREGSVVSEVNKTQSFNTLFCTNLQRSKMREKTNIFPNSQLSLGLKQKQIPPAKDSKTSFRIETTNRLLSDTSTKEGLANVLTEATLELLRHSDYCISCYSSVDVKRSDEEGENRFNRLSLDERGKIHKETLVNVNSIKQKSSNIQKASGFCNEYIVVTILVATKGTIQKLQPINGIADLKEALLTLGSIPKSRIVAVEILWTPQDEKEALSERELLQDYSVLKPF